MGSSSAYMKRELEEVRRGEKPGFEVERKEGGRFMLGPCVLLSLLPFPPLNIWRALAAGVGKGQIESKLIRKEGLGESEPRGKSEGNSSSLLSRKEDM